MALSEELAWRGFVNQTTYKDTSILDTSQVTFYWGVDPSSDSMTIGNLAAAMMVRHFIDEGHKAILLVGGATGMIGDPDGKSTERDLLTIEQIAANKASIAEQYKRIFAGKEFEIVDNYDWFKGMNYLTFLRDVGKHVPMRQMLGREFVQSRLGEEGAGISYAEFSYSLIQGYDFLHLHRVKGVSLQLCGADQWGNSIAGVELIRRITGNEAHIWSAPLIVNKQTGVKFGKSEEGAVWLDANKTSVYMFYQFWLNLDDESAIDLLKIYTLLSREEIEDIIKKFTGDRASRLAQKTLAYEVTRLVHGQEEADKVVRESQKLFAKQDYSTLSADAFKELEESLSVFEVQHGKILLQILTDSGLAGSNTEARRFLASGAVYINDKQVPENKLILDENDFLHGYIVLRRGKNTQVLLKQI